MYICILTIDCVYVRGPVNVCHLVCVWSRHSPIIEQLSSMYHWIDRWMNRMLHHPFINDQTYYRLSFSVDHLYTSLYSVKNDNSKSNMTINDVEWTQHTITDNGGRRHYNGWTKKKKRSLIYLSLSSVGWFFSNYEIHYDNH